MKKIVLMFAVFCGVLSLSAENLPIAGWKISTMQGKFSYQLQQYPLQIKCAEPLVKDGQALVWGRVYRRETLEVGKKYEIKVTYKLTESPKGAIAVWVRDGGQFNLFGRANADGKTLSRQFTASKDYVMIYINLREGTGNLEVVSVELNKLD